MLWLLKCLLHRPGLMWNRFSEIAWPFFSLLFRALRLLSFPFLPLPLFFCASVPPRRALCPSGIAHETCCRHIVFIARSLPAGTRPRRDWLADADEPARYAALPILLTFPSGNESVTAKRIWARTYGQIIHLTHRYAGWHSHTCTLEKCNVFINASVFSFSPFSCRPADSTAQKIQILKYMSPDYMWL